MIAKNRNRKGKREKLKEKCHQMKHKIETTS